MPTAPRTHSYSTVKDQRPRRLLPGLVANAIRHSAALSLTCPTAPPPPAYKRRRRALLSSQHSYLIPSVPSEQGFAHHSLILTSCSSCSCRREFANNDEKKPGVRCRGIGSLYRKQKPGVRTASTRTSTASWKSKRVPRVEIPVC
ncbi:hypothetical protein PVAP13_7KG177355 [Panicum virgatum]|uniref:Uncharacterized protein n=1 Tax=Panicum virgatum TaxID=38727 RepID=A0A8T0QHZ5_PANVG|nr:hypothetical protein PVAP13_7KG177355 [Panicum virgatum]